MKFLLERVTQPQIEPLTLAEMKTSLREFSSVTDLDADVTSIIQGAREWAEDFTGRALVDQTWRLSICERLLHFTTFTDANKVTGIYYGDWFASARGILLRKSPALSIVSFATVNADGTETAIDPTLYQLREPNSKWPRLVGLSGAKWSGEVRITFRAGYADRSSSPQQDAGVIPERFKMAMKLYAEANYDRDEKRMQLLLDTAERLLLPERCELGLA